MELYIIEFYDANESGNVEHHEVYTGWWAAMRRYNTLERNLNCYSWVCLYKGVSKFGRVRCGDILYRTSSCNGKDNYYHGDHDDF